MANTNDTQIAIDGEILGLKASNNGRSCERHTCCGSQVKYGNFVVFRLCQVTNELTDEDEDAIKVILLQEDGTEGCHVGFLSRFVVGNQDHRAKVLDKKAVVVELYEESEDKSLKKANLRGYGVASFILLESFKEEDLVPT